MTATPGGVDDNGNSLPGGGDTQTGVHSHDEDLLHLMVEANALPTQTHLQNLGGTLSAPQLGSPQQIASLYLQNNAAQLGLSSADVSLGVVSDFYTSEHTGVSHVYFRQMLHGLEVVNADINVNISPQGEVLSVGSSFLGGISSIQKPLVLEPNISASAALSSFATAIDDSLTSNPQIVNAPFGFAQHTVLAAPDFAIGDVDSELVYVPTPSGGVELAWKLNVQTDDGEHWFDVSVSAQDGDVLHLVDWAADLAQYNVFHYNLASPQDGNRSLITDPADSVASPFGWHDTDGVAGDDFTDTRGNNVFAQEDADDNDTGGNRPSGGTAGNLVFDFTWDQTMDADVSEDASITNLFYVNNILHDIHYHYGFTEAAGNFQENNYGNGGLGGDAVRADALDGSGTNNANFFTPPDGTPGRMQQFIFTLTTPTRDSSMENDIVVHEYGHGVSNRLTGGPSNAGALTALQSGGMGEGWSDFWSLMFAQNSTDQQFDAYPIGNYVLGQAPTDVGVRRFPYSFDMNINPLTYGSFNGGFPNNEVHNSGEIWAQVLWDMNWLLINGDGGQIPAQGFDPDLYNGTGGNNLALQLVMDGLKLQPANPTMLDARDAILLADQMLTGGQNELAIWTAFARRGFGYSADDGGNANSDTVVEAFDLPPEPVVNITGRKWNDDNANGRRDSGEGFLSGWTIYADLNNNGKLDGNEPSDVTDENGVFELVDLDPGAYRIREVMQATWEQTFPSSGSHSVVLTSGGVVSGIDFGNRLQDGSIEGHKWHDLNGNQTQDEDEPGLAGVLIYVDVNNDGRIGIGEPAAITSSSGYYKISGLRPGEYEVRENVQPGWQQTFPAPTGLENGRSPAHTVTVDPGKKTKNIDFGNVASADADYGDARDRPYPTSPSSNGASHGYLEGFQLGDSFGDDDGVTFTDGQIIGQVNEIVVDVRTGGHPIGRLQGFLDLNSDGDWKDDGEWVLRNVQLTEGIHTLTYTIPDDVVVNPEFAPVFRIRYGYEYDFNYLGRALAGEVEDYQVYFTEGPRTGAIAGDDEFSVDEDSTDNELDVTRNDAPGPNNDTILIVDVNGQGTSGFIALDHGVLEVLPGTVLYTPDPDFVGTDTFTYTVRDEVGNEATATATIHVLDVNDGPTAVDDELIAFNDRDSMLDVLANDMAGSDANDSISIVAFDAMAMEGSIQIDDDGLSIIYSPPSDVADFEGTETFSYTIRDEGGLESTATVVLRVVEPVLTAADDMFTVEEDSVENEFDVLRNDLLGPEGGTLTIENIAQSPNSRARLNLERDRIIYTPDLDFIGTDVFSYTISDGLGGLETASVTVFVENLPDPPDAVDDEINVLEGAQGVRLNVLANDTSAPDPADVLTITDVTQPADGMVTIEDGGLALIYTPAGTLVGGDTETFTYTIVDSDGLTDTATVTILIQEPTALVEFRLQTVDSITGEVIPTVNRGQNFTLEVYAHDLRGAPGAGEARGVLQGYLDVLYDELRVSVVDGSRVDGPLYGAQNGSPRNNITAVPPVLDEMGSSLLDLENPPGFLEELLFSIEFTATDTGIVSFIGEQADEFLNSVVLPSPATDINPRDILYGMTDINVIGFEAIDDTFEILEDSGTSTFDVLLNDINVGAGGTNRIESAPSQSAQGGTVMIVNDLIAYRPADDFFGSDTFTYTMTNGVRSSTATVTVLVENVNDPPTAVDDMVTVPEDSIQAPIDVLANDLSDPDPAIEKNFLRVVSARSNTPQAQVELASGGVAVLYTPPPNFFGTDTFTYTIEDPDGAQHQATVTVTVESRNDPPIANDDLLFAEYAEDVNGIPLEVDLDVLANDSILPDANETLTIINLATPPGFGGSVRIAADGMSVIYRPASNSEGERDEFDYTISDGTTTAQAHVIVDVDLPGFPKARRDTFTVQEGSQDNLIDVLANDKPFPGATLELLSVTQPANGTVDFDMVAQTIRYTPNADFFDVDTFTYTVTDDDAGSAPVTATVTIIVEPLFLPRARDDEFTVDEDSGPTQFDLLDNDAADIGGTLIIVDTSGDGTIMGSQGGTITIDPADGLFVTYQPAPDVQGTETFDYTIQDTFNGGTDVGTVTVTINNLNDNPMAVDDSFEVIINSGDNLFDVLANDLSDPDPAETFTIVEINGLAVGANDIKVAHGTVSVSGGTMLTYRPDAGYEGPDTFTYTISDPDGGMDTANVLIDVVKADLVGITLVTLNDGVETSDFVIGDTVTLQIFVQDLRGDSPGQARGVFQAVFDILYDASLIEIIDGSLVHGDTTIYGDSTADGSPTNQTGIPGLIDEASSTAITTDNIGTTPVFFLQFEFTALAGGMMDFTTNQTEFPVGNETAILDSVDAVPLDQITFGSTGISIAAPAPPLQNTENPLDVDGNGTVDGADAQAIYNELAAHGS
ncbi:MAG: M36 family metallopeptidase, partial [Planctomycetales bacterium]|nr:M36 family metallopeptidase [Planctomycetales bacterium]